MGNKLNVKLHGNVEQTISILNDLIATLKKGTLTVKNNGDFVTLHPGDAIELELKASKKEDREKFELRLNWNTIPTTQNGHADLVITDEEVSEKKADEAEEPELVGAGSGSKSKKSKKK